MLQITIDQTAELLGIAKRSQGTVNQPNDLAEANFRGWAAQLVPALGAAYAFHDAGVFQLQQNQFQEFLGKDFLIGNIADADGSLIVVAGQHHHGLQRIKPLLGDFHDLDIMPDKPSCSVEFIWMSALFVNYSESIRMIREIW